jgi:arylformamidase
MPSRRAALVGGAAFAAMAPVLLRSAAAQTAPKVFLDYTQAELDRAYDQANWAPNIQHVIKRYGTASEAVRKRLGPPKTVSYGLSAIETLDIHAAKKTGAPILVFLHDGAWRSGRAAEYAGPAETFVNAGAHYVAVDFAPVTEVGLDGMVAQVRRAVAWTYKNEASFGGDPERL